MHKIRVYVDTSVFGGTQDEDFAEISKLFFKRVHESLTILSTFEVSYDEQNENI